MPRVSRAEMRSPAWTKNLDGSRPEIATFSSASNFAADIEMLIWKFAGLRSSPSPTAGTNTIEPTALFSLRPRSSLRSRMRRNPVSGFEPASRRERHRLALGHDDPHHEDALAPLLDDEPRLGRPEGDERHRLAARFRRSAESRARTAGTPDAGDGNPP